MCPAVADLSGNVNLCEALAPITVRSRPARSCKRTGDVRCQAAWGLKKTIFRGHHPHRDDSSLELLDRLAAIIP